MFGEPAPSTYHSLEGLPGRQFSASIAFWGAVHVARAETDRLACTNVTSRTLLKAKLIRPDLCHWRCSACCRRGGSCATCWAGVVKTLVFLGIIVSPEGATPGRAPPSTPGPGRPMLGPRGQSP